MDIYDKILIELKNNRLTKGELADFIGISREHFTRIFNKKDLSTLQLMKVREFFKTHKIDIIEPKIIKPDYSDITSLRKSKPL